MSSKPVSSVSTTGVFFFQYELLNSLIIHIFRGLTRGRGVRHTLRRSNIIRNMEGFKLFLEDMQNSQVDVENETSKDNY